MSRRSSVRYDNLAVIVRAEINGQAICCFPEGRKEGARFGVDAPGIQWRAYWRACGISALLRNTLPEKLRLVLVTPIETLN